jgi:uncharacterized repeat protein (TIGR03803 family)
MKQIAFGHLAGGLIALAAVVVPTPARAGNGITVLHSFDYLDGQYPEGRLVQGNDGAFYGTTYAGGANGYGEVYKVTADGTFTILHSFAGPDGTSLDSGLLLRTDGDFYGTTPQTSFCDGSICSGDGGTVFRMKSDGTLTTLHVFSDGVAGWQPGPLAEGFAGQFYGLTVQGGSVGEGAAFSIAPDGAFSQLNGFDGANGGLPHGALVLAADGNFYGTTSVGGAENKGTVFRMTPAGVITTLHSFSGGDDGATPYGTLVQGNDGRFYGGTSSGGGGGAGTAFVLSADGTLTTLHAFNGGDGTGPVGGLVQGNDGTFYGVSGGGYLGYGTLFRLSPDGQFMTLHLFSPSEGTSPVSTPIFGADGRLYGTTIQYGGAAGASGSVYAFDLSAPRVPELHLTKTCINEFDKCFRPFNTGVGQTVRLDWASADLATCMASGAWNGSRPTGGSYTFRTTRPGAFVYRLDCNGPDGKASQQVVLTVIR